jgi:hypothetical protein
MERTRENEEKWRKEERTEGKCLKGEEKMKMK